MTQGSYVPSSQHVPTRVSLCVCRVMPLHLAAPCFLSHAGSLSVSVPCPTCGRRRVLQETSAGNVLHVS